MSSTTHRHSASGRRLAPFVVAVLALVLGGYGYYRRQVQDIRRDRYGSLEAVAEMKTRQIVAWRRERFMDARVYSADLVRTDVLQWLEAPADEALTAGLLARLKMLAEAEGYRNLVLAGPDGRLLLSLVAHLMALDDETKQLVAQVVAAREPAFGDFVRCALDQQVYLDVAAPILDDAERPVAVLLLRSDPRASLYPLVRSWPTPSQSAETLLLRRDGDHVLLLNTLRHSSAPALTLRIPVSRIGVPAVQAATGRTGAFEGRDYRGVAVLSDLRPVPDSPWLMVTKVDTREILAEARHRGGMVLLFVALGIVLTGLLAVSLFSHRQRSLYERLYRGERKEREAQEIIRAAFYGIGDGVIATDAQGRVTRLNPTAERLTGWGEAEALGRPLGEVFRTVSEETRAEVEDPVTRVLRDGAVAGLANHTVLIARDGTERPIADSGAPIRTAQAEVAGVVLVFRDQTAERAAQARLREREAFARSALDAVGANVAVLDRHGVITAVNAAWEQFARENGDASGGAATGVGVDYLAVLRAAQGPSTESAAAALAGIQDVLAGGHPGFAIEYPCDAPDRQRWFMLRATPLAGEAGGAVLAHIDISARRQAEHDLRASETRYRRLFESAKDGILILDADSGRIVDVNPFLVALLGYTHAEFLGKHLWEIGVFRDVAASKEAYLELQAKGYARYEDLPLETRDGRRIAVEFVSNVYSVNSTRVVQCNIRDITERQRARRQEEAADHETRRMLEAAEQSRRALLSVAEDQKRAEEVLARERYLLRTLIDNLPDYIYTKDSEGRFVVANSAVTRGMGRRVPAELVGRTDADCYPPELAAQHRADELQVIQSGRALLEREESVVDSAGNQRWFSTTRVPLRDGAGNTVGLVGIGRDITGHKRAEAERERLQAQLAQAQKLEAVGTLAGGVAHEINNPVNGIMNYAQLIVDDAGATSPVGGYAAEILHETERVATIVRNLLAFSRQDTADHSPARVEDIVAGTLSLVRTVLRHDQITLEVDVPADLPAITCRSQQIQQVLMNLLTNARDALNEKYPGFHDDKRIRVTAVAMDSGLRTQGSAAGPLESAAPAAAAGGVQNVGGASRLRQGYGGQARRRPVSLDLAPCGRGVEAPPTLDTLDTGPSLNPQPGPRRWVRLTVEDHGPGIPPELRERILDPFFTTKPRGKGTGLGLSISHSIVTGHGGALTFESEPGQWTRFHVDLPVDGGEAAEGAREAIRDQ